jgi:hypothetical protein
MCIDFTDLNKACPKDEFPLPRIDKIVDLAASCKVMSLLDSLPPNISQRRGQNKCHIYHTLRDTYYFMRMLKGLKNVESTFSRLTQSILKY